MQIAATCTGTVGVYLTTHHRLDPQGAAEPIWRLAHCTDRVPLRDIPRAYPLQMENTALEDEER